MIRRPPRSTRVRSSAASDVYKRQDVALPPQDGGGTPFPQEEGVGAPLGQEPAPGLCASTFGSMPLATRVLAARRPRIEAFEVSPVYLMDTGSGHDIVSHDLANAHAQFVNRAKRMSFSTANGEIGSHYTLLMRVGALEGTSTPYVLPDSPPLLSVAVSYTHLTLPTILRV